MRCCEKDNYPKRDLSNTWIYFLELIPNKEEFELLLLLQCLGFVDMQMEVSSKNPINKLYIRTK